MLNGYALVAILTLGLGYFLLKARLTEFIVRNTSYGETPLEIANLKKPFNGIYARFFPDPPPARSTFQVAALPKGARVEIEAVAVRERA